MSYRNDEWKTMLELFYSLHVKSFEYIYLSVSFIFLSQGESFLSELNLLCITKSELISWFWTIMNINRESGKKLISTNVKRFNVIFIMFPTSESILSWKLSTKCKRFFYFSQRKLVLNSEWKVYDFQSRIHENHICFSSLPLSLFFFLSLSF